MTVKKDNKSKEGVLLSKASRIQSVFTLTDPDDPNIRRYWADTSDERFRLKKVELSKKIHDALLARSPKTDRARHRYNDAWFLFFKEEDGPDVALDLVITDRPRGSDGAPGLTGKSHIKRKTLSADGGVEDDFTGATVPEEEQVEEDVPPGSVLFSSRPGKHLPDVTDKASLTEAQKTALWAECCDLKVSQLRKGTELAGGKFTLNRYNSAGGSVSLLITRST